MGFRITGNGTSVLATISGSINQVSLQQLVTALDDTGLGDVAHTYVDGLFNATVSLNGYVNTTTDAIFGAHVNGTSVARTAKTWEVKLATGSLFYNGSCLITDYSVSGGSDTLQTFSATLQVSGDVNRTAAALA